MESFRTIAGLLDAPVAPNTDHDLEILVGNAGFSISSRPGGSTGTASDGPGVRHWRDLVLDDYRAEARERGLKGKAVGTYAWQRLAEVLETGIATKVNPGLKTRKARIRAVEAARYATATRLFIAEEVLTAGLASRRDRRRR